MQPLKLLLEFLKSSAINRLIRQVDPDVVYFPFHLDTCSLKNSVVTVHDLAEELGPFRDRRLARRVSANVQGASAVVSSWPHPFSQLQAEFPNASEKLFMIPVPPLVISDKSARELPPPCIDAAEYILYAAATARHKNHLRLVQALSEVVGRRRVHLVCTGPRLSPWYEESADLAHDLGIDAYVTFTGFVAADQLASLYQHSSMVVAPTLWEAASGTVFEAFWYERPVACSDIPALRRQVELVQGKARFFDAESPTDIASAICEVLENPTPYREGAVQAKSHLQEFTWERAADSYLSVFEWVANGAHPDELPIET